MRHVTTIEIVVLSQMRMLNQSPISCSTFFLMAKNSQNVMVKLLWVDNIFLWIVSYNIDTFPCNKTR
jgi:hypothetical protein